MRIIYTLLAILLIVSSAPAETLRKRYTFELNPATRRASEARALASAKKMFLRDFLSTKFSPEIVNNLAEEIDIALDPADEYLMDELKVVSTKDEGDKLVMTVEGDVNLPAMVSALVRNKVLSFGERPPKVMFLPSSKFESPGAVKSLRALVFDKLRQSGLQSVAFEGTTETLSTQIKGKVTANSQELRILQKLVTQYNADYLIYVDVDANNRPASVGGFICDANFTYTVLRPNNNVILGEDVVSARGSGNTAMLAFDRVLDQVSPVIVNQAVGQLYQAIYADSDVIYDTPQLRNTIAVTVYEAKSDQVKRIIEALQSAGASVTLGSGTGISSRLTVDTTLDTLGLYNFFNEQTYTQGAARFKTPVVGYAENSIDIEITDASKPPSRPKPAKPPAPKPRTVSNNSGDAKEPDQIASRLKSRTKPVVTFKLKPLVPNR